MESEKRLDLIDRNALLAELDKFANPMPNESGYEFLRGIATAITEIEDASTVDAVEVVHGRWIAVPSSDMMTGKAYKCSECNKMRYGSFMPNYCQICGAKMDGGNEDG